MEQFEPLEQRLKTMLLSQGPRFKELKEKLEELGTAGVAHLLDAFKAQEGFAWQDDSEDPEGPINKQL